MKSTEYRNLNVNKSIYFQITKNFFTVVPEAIVSSAYFIIVAVIIAEKKLSTQMIMSAGVQG